MAMGGVVSRNMIMGQSLFFFLIYILLVTALVCAGPISVVKKKERD